MALNIPTLSETVNRILTSIKNKLENSNPFLRNSFLNILGVALAGIVQDFLEIVKTVILPNIFPQTAKDEYLEMWGEVKKVTRNAATKASGFIAATGTLSSVIPKDTELQSSNGFTYKTLLDSIIQANSVSVSSLTQTGGIATATTASEHNLGTGIDVTISGANESDYNGTFEVTVTGLTTFTYSINPSAPGTATGTILAAYDTASIEVESIDFGIDTNVAAGASLVFTSPISGVDDTAIVQYSAIGGGADIESDSDYRIRTFEAWQGIGTPFNDVNIIAKAKEVTGVTRVFVKRITPGVGDTTVYFLINNAIPTPTEVNNVKNEILKILPTNMREVDLYVLAPTPVVVDFTFSSLSPNTDTMKTSIIENLEEFFAARTEVGKNLLEIEYNSAIINTIDSETGDNVQSFTLSTPSGDVSISSGELAILGTVTF